MRIIRVTKEEFELEDGGVYPILPPLQEEMSIEEFQKHYDYASTIVRGCEKVGGDHADPPGLGQGREDKNC